jgi:hypothetical protein
MTEEINLTTDDRKWQAYTEVCAERDKYRLALQQVVEMSKPETWAWVIAEEALDE